MTPSVGRTVHYLDREQLAKGELAQPYAAVITRVVWGDRVCLGVFHPELGYRIQLDVDKGEHAGGWRWPPRVEEQKPQQGKKQESVAK